MSRAELLGGGHAMVAVHHKVSVADLVDLDIRHASRAFHSYFDPGPPRLILILARQKAAGKIGIAPHAADDGIDGNVLQST